MARLFADEQFPARIVSLLRRSHGHDVKTVQQTNQSKYGDGKEDRLVLQIAMDEQRAVLTLNRKHFRQLHQDCGWHWGIISVVRSDNPKRDADLIDEAIKWTLQKHGTLRGHYIAVPPPTGR